MKYIDTEKLKAEIERLQEFNNSMSNNAINSNMRNFYDGEVDCCKQLLSFIDSLQKEQPEVDLEKEIKNKRRTMLLDLFGLMNGVQCLAIEKFARYFYELGLKARKEE